MICIIFITFFTNVYDNKNDIFNLCTNNNEFITDSNISNIGNYIVIGEFHGTIEVPVLINYLLCKYILFDKSVLFIIEFPDDMNKDIVYFINGKTTEDNFFSLNFWSVISDGRSGEATANLFRNIRRLKAAGQKIDVRAISVPLNSPQPEESRDRFMARKFSEFVHDSHAEAVVALVGRLHARKADVPLPDGRTLTPMAAALPSFGIDLRRFKSLKVEFTGGDSWSCGNVDGKVECGIFPLPDNENAKIGLKLYEEPGRYFDGEIVLGRAHPSLPLQKFREQPK